MDSSNNNSFFHSPITHHSQQPDNPDVNPHSDSNMHDAHHHQTLLGYHDSESDQPWNTSIVRTSLRQAVVELSNHSLKLASKWAAEQLMGLPLITSNSNTPRIMKRESISRSDSLMIFNMILQPKKLPQTYIVLLHLLFLLHTLLIMT